jgi:SAM-dependent methyltransferase
MQINTLLGRVGNGKEADMADKKVVYGAAQHYQGNPGKEYFAWQNQAVLFKGLVNSHKFKHLIKPSDVVLDFGCGGGGLLLNLTCQTKIGVEINEHARAFANEHGITCFESLSEVPDGTIDVAVSDHALEHVPYPIQALREINQKLKPNGLLSVCVPIDNWRAQRRYDPQDINHHLHTWTPQNFGNSLQEAGFAVVELYPRTLAWIPGWTVALYSRLPYWAFRAIGFVYGTITGKGQEIMCVARRA